MDDKRNKDSRRRIPAMAVLAVAVIGFTGFDQTYAYTIQSHVEDSAIDNNNGTWTYNYTVFNDSTGIFDPETEALNPIPVIIDWELPYFSDAGITSIASPDGWDWAIETIGVENTDTGWGGIAAWQDPSDPLYAGATSPFTTVTQVLHWYTTCQPNDECNFAGIFPDGFGFSETNSLGGFSFVANYGPTGAPYQASWDIVPVQTGDPAYPQGGLPASPLAIASVPEPGAFSLLAIGAIGMLFARRRNAKRLS